MKFIRQCYHKYKKLDKKWRKPKGMSSKARRYRKARVTMPSIGYGRANSEKNLHPSGLRDVLVNNLKELESLDPKTQAARIASGVGGRKKEIMVKRASELKVKVLNQVK